ncbi:hypothetical protein N658DRAFT_203747 [Parathielavia hyrcaniae]|uniref:Uncharacterized protein n=1 Tax=Parathielavia hyrcaniae TaxID=113614 RepID=A0AAN6SZC9_9PEZI|nr:hypothetical protein N658DRAFT_203747 [Parathielavia hyrcaniae]
MLVLAVKKIRHQRDFHIVVNPTYHSGAISVAASRMAPAAWRIPPNQSRTARNDQLGAPPAFGLGGLGRCLSAGHAPIDPLDFTLEKRGARGTIHRRGLSLRHWKAAIGPPLGRLHCPASGHLRAECHAASAGSGSGCLITSERELMDLNLCGVDTTSHCARRIEIVKANEETLEQTSQTIYPPCIQYLSVDDISQHLIIHISMYLVYLGTDVVQNSHDTGTRCVYQSLCL